MKKKFATKALVVMVAAFVIGLILVFCAGTMGQNAGSVAIRKNGGSMDTSAYERIISTTTTNFQIAGGVLSVIGGCGLLLSGYATYKEM